ncbi:hypothetical protein TELCIR_20998 [Teladorsagia circumcincta]|uniref:Uncharacterized protein n=1 Tax=Teladorsagia circumcincta TaxID=45464 RepID=A0A2G9THX4_TELCI|nr:hypothetical protein TELCIR_20998 [Teladorsagia circumcincta]
MQSAQIPINVTVKIDPAFIGSGQYHYTNIIVHFDLKGAPPKIQYFLELLELVAKSGATGILIEWEDMFPWSGELRRVMGEAITEKHKEDTRNIDRQSSNSIHRRVKNPENCQET